MKLSPRIIRQFLEKLSEKGYEHSSNCGFEGVRRPKWSEKPSPWRPTGLRRGRLLPFSDSFVGEFSEVHTQNRV